jgi:hypothetical protein
MIVNVFKLKARDTLPILEVALLNPDDTPFDLTGSTAWKLHIKLSDGITRLVRSMTVSGDPTLGVLQYAWGVTDWDAASSPDGDGSYQVGGLVAGPTIPLTPGQVEHRMEYEVIGPSGARLTFPNEERFNDILRITPDIGQG